MAALGFLSTIKFGPPGSEITFPNTDAITRFQYPFAWNTWNYQTEVQNWLGERFTNLFRRLMLQGTVTLPEVSEQKMFSLKSLNAQTAQEMALILANAWPVYSVPYFTDDTTHVTLTSDPFLRLDKAYNALGLGAQVAITGVFTTNDPTGQQGGTNYFTGGSLNRSTWQITLGNGSPGAAGTQVYVNYTYQGALVKTTGGMQVNVAPYFNTDGGPLWAVTFDFVGI